MYSHCFTDEDENSDSNDKSQSTPNSASKSTPTTSNPTSTSTSPTETDTTHTTPQPHNTRSSSQALQVTTHFLSKVRDLAPTISPSPSPSSTSKPSANTRPNSSTPSNHEATNNHSNASSPTSPSAAAANKNTSQSVKELQNLISQYVQRQRAMATANSSTPVSPSNPPTPRGAATPLIPPNNTSNQSRGTIPVSASTIIANKFNNAMMLAANSTLQAQNSKHTMPGNASGNRATATTRATNNRSMLDNSIPVLSVQYKQQRHEKRQRTTGREEDLPDFEDNSNYFLNAAHHELQNMEDEIMSSDNIYNSFILFLY